MEVLVVLAGTTRPLTGRQVAKLVRTGSQGGVNRTLQRLGRHGLVSSEPAGRALLYTLNRDHLAAPAVEALASLRTALLVRLKEAIAGWTVKPVHASLFGSAARADGDLSSDIDLFIVGPRTPRSGWDKQLEKLSDEVRTWTGNRASVIEVAPEELVRLRSRRPEVVAELLQDAQVLYGPSIKSLLSAGRFE